MERVAGQVTVPQSRPAASRRGGALRRSLARPGALMVPALLFLAVFFVYPLWDLVLSSLNSDGESRFAVTQFSLRNYREVFGDETFWTMFRNTITLALLATLITMVVSYPTAYFISRAPRRLARFLLLAVLVPYFSSILIRLYAFTQILTPFGLNQTTAGAVIGMIAYLMPFMVIMLYAAMVSIDSNLDRAARTLGARPWRAFRRIFFPLSRSGLVAATLFAFVVSLGFYLTPAILGDTTRQVLSTYVQQKASVYEFGSASAVGVTLLVMTLFLFAFSSKALSAPTALTAGTGKGVSAHRFRWSLTMVVMAVWSFVVVLFLALPLIVVVWTSFTSETYLEFPPSGYSLRWYREVISDPTWWSSAWLSLKIGLLTAVISTVLGLGAAFGFVRGRTRLRGPLQIFFYAPLIVPVVLLGAALFGFEVRARMTGTLAGYTAGHVLLTLPITVIVLTTALSAVPRQTELAARTLGATAFQAFRKVTMPAISVSVGACLLISFLTSWDEAVVSLFLATDQQTLPVKYLLFMRQQLLPSMAAVGTLLLLATVVAYFGAVSGAKLGRRMWRSQQLRREKG